MPMELLHTNGHGEGPEETYNSFPLEVVNFNPHTYKCTVNVNHKEKDINSIRLNTKGNLFTVGPRIVLYRWTERCIKQFFELINWTLRTSLFIVKTEMGN